MTEATVTPLPDDSWRDAVAHLASRDKVLGRVIAAMGPCGLKARDGGFTALMDIIAAQQVSKYAADSIRKRLRKSFGDPPDVAKVAASRTQRLRNCGVSGAKAKYIRGIAREVVSGRLDFDHPHRQNDADAIERLLALNGIGRWTAEIYLMFAHGRPDIMPGLDLGLVVAAQHLKRLRKRPDAKRLLKIAEAWRPWRSAAALLLWHYRRSMPDWGPKPLKEDIKVGKTAK